MTGPAMMLTLGDNCDTDRGLHGDNDDDDIMMTRKLITDGVTIAILMTIMMLMKVFMIGKLIVGTATMIIMLMMIGTRVWMERVVMMKISIFATIAVIMRERMIMAVGRMQIPISVTTNYGNADDGMTAIMMEMAMMIWRWLMVVIWMIQASYQSRTLNDMLVMMLMIMLYSDGDALSHSHSVDWNGCRDDSYDEGTDSLYN